MILDYDYVFDLDGVIIDFESAVSHFYEKLYGEKLDVSKWTSYNIRKVFSEKVSSRIEHIFTLPQIYESRWLYSEIPHVIDSIKSQGKTCAVLTACTTDELVHVKKNFIEDQFSIECYTTSWSKESYEVKGIYVDDYPQNLIDVKSSQSFLRAQRWNSKKENEILFNRVSSISEILGLTSHAKTFIG